MDSTSQNTLGFTLHSNFAIALLDSWGVSKETQAVLQEYNLDVFCIENISDSDINELIPKSRIKDRIKFKAGLAQFKNENKSLVELDFEFMYPNHDLELFKKWPIFMEKALPIYSKIKSCVDNLKTLNDNSTTPDVRDYVYLKLMSSKLPPTIKIPVQHSSIHFTCRESERNSNKDQAASG